jgi:transcription initiation factor IIE alpha subunit
MSELKGVCPKCGARYYGWALINSIEQKCDRCGSDLEFVENRVHIRTHYSSFTTKTFKTMHPTLHERNE